MIKDKLGFIGNTTSDPTPVINKWYTHPVIDGKTAVKLSLLAKTGILSGYRGTPEGHKGGEYVQKLCEYFKDYLGVKYAIAFNSATSALHAACVACGLEFGDEVIVSPYTFSSSASCVLMAGGIPIFADIDEDIFNIKAETISPLINERTKGIIPVHLAGHSCDMDDIMALAARYRLFVIEDSAQTLGGTYKGDLCGTIGDVGIFSFNQSKPVSTGEGGMAVTNNPYIARKLMAVMNHGEVSDPEARVVGYNYRMTEMVALLALEQMKTLEERNLVRRGLNEYLAKRISQIEGFHPPVVKKWAKHVYYTTMLKANWDKLGITREEFQKGMVQLGGYFGSGYVTPLYLYPIYTKYAPAQYRFFTPSQEYKEGLCPVTERMWKKELCVTDVLRYPATYDDVDNIMKMVRRLCNV